MFVRTEGTSLAYDTTLSEPTNGRERLLTLHAFYEKG